MIRSIFDKETISDLDYSLHREYLLSSPSGAYTSSSIAGCNTRKYHGLLVAPQSNIDDDSHVLLSTIDESIHYNGETHLLGFHQYPDAYYPEGYLLIDEFSANPIPRWTYRIGDILLVKELLLLSNDGGVMIRYSVHNTDQEIMLDLMPLLAFRNVHRLRHADMIEGKKFDYIDNGIRLKPYRHYGSFNIQLSRKADFVPMPEWYYNIEYIREQERGYDFREDLYAPGYFSLSLKKGEQVVLIAGLEESSSKTLKTRFTNEIKKKANLMTLDDCLENAAHQFIIEGDKRTMIKAGFPWFGTWGRDTFISLPGLCLSTGNTKLFKAIIESALPDLKDGLFPNVGSGKYAAYNSVDASLWFIWALQQYVVHSGKEDEIWKKYGKYMASILDNYKNGTLHHIKMDADGLIYAGEKGIALTWMDSVVDGKPVTPRTGKAVEINALWYNAVCFCLESAYLAEDRDFFHEWENLPLMIKESFTKTFWDEQKGYLADCVNGDHKDWSIRPNQIIAVSLHFSPIPHDHRKSIIEKVETRLLTPRGLRTLAIEDPNYKGKYQGDQKSRDIAYHQGTVWPWLIGHYAEAYLREYGDEAIPYLQEIYTGFEAAMEEQCLFTIAEIYNGDFPHHAAGAISQAWSIAELLRMRDLIKYHKEAAKHKLKKEELQA